MEQKIGNCPKEPKSGHDKRRDLQFAVGHAQSRTVRNRAISQVFRGCACRRSAPSLRMAGVRIITDDEPSLRASSDAGHALTVALVKPGRGSCWNQIMS